jgi:hypothetical protein
VLKLHVQIWGLSKYSTVQRTLSDEHIMFMLTSISLLLRLLEYGEGETSLPISASRFYLDSYVKRIKRKGERGVVTWIRHIRHGGFTRQFYLEICKCIERGKVAIHDNWSRYIVIFNPSITDYAMDRVFRICFLLALHLLTGWELKDLWDYVESRYQESKSQISIRQIGVSSSPTEANV